MMTELDDAQKKILKDRQRLWARQTEKNLSSALDDLKTIKYTVMQNDQLGGKTNWETMRKLSQAVALLNELWIEIPIIFDPEYRKGDKNDGTRTNR